MGKKMMAKKLRKVPVFANGKEIGYIYEDSDNAHDRRKKGKQVWGSVSYACMEKSGGLEGHWGFDTRREAVEDVRDMHEEYTGTRLKVYDLMTELRFARKIIRRMKRETNEFDEGRAVANKALKRLDQAIKEAIHD